MARFFAYLRQLLTEEPAVTAWFTSGGLAMLAAYVLHFSQTQEAAAATIVTALAAIYTALTARPASISMAVGALVTIVTAAAAFGFHPSQHSVALGTALVSALLALLFRQNISPVALLRKRAAAKARRQPRMTA